MERERIRREDLDFSLRSFLSLSLSLISLPISPPRLPSKTAPLDSRFVELFVDAKLVEVGSSEAPRENWIELVPNSAGWKQKK